MHTSFILPGLYNSGAGHWQTIWEEIMPNAVRVQQHQWDAPNRSEWVATLDSVVRAAQGPLVLIAHSLGCALTAWWAACHGHEAYAQKVRSALLVAPPNVEREDFPKFVVGFSPMPRQCLPFKAIVVASSNDPWCPLEKACGWAKDWGAQFHDIGALGHINGESGLGQWEQGQQWLAELQA